MQQLCCANYGVADSKPAGFINSQVIMTLINRPFASQATYKVKPVSQALALLLFFWGQPTISQAEALDEGSTVGRSGVVTPSGNPMLLAPFIYIPPTGANKSQQVEAEHPKRSADQQRIVDLNAAAKYQAVGTEGLALMAKEEVDAQLQLIVANSLAWTGRLKEAVPTYQGLAKGELANEANIGLANIYRWRGRDDQAAPMYRAVLAAAPDNSDAQEGLALTSRELSPKTTLSFGGATDSSETVRRSATINHRWRDTGGSNIMEIETSAVRDELPTAAAGQQEVSFRYQNLGLELKPSFKLSMPTKTDSSVYGSVRIQLLEDQVSLEGGRVNWGRMVVNPNALAAHLSASHAGISASHSFEYGNLSGNLNYYDISDGNVVQTGGLQFSSAWRPIGNNLKPFVGIETRSARFNTSSYWSPVDGSGALFAGILGEWGAADWNIFASAQSGTRLYGDAGQSWSLSAGGKRWLSTDVAISLNLWSMASTRDNATYRASSAAVNLEKLWR